MLLVSEGAQAWQAEEGHPERHRQLAYGHWYEGKLVKSG